MHRKVYPLQNHPKKKAQARKPSGLRCYITLTTPIERLAMSPHNTVIPASAQPFCAAFPAESSNFSSQAAQSGSFSGQNAAWAQYEQVAFDHAVEALRRMSGSSQADLAQAAKSYFYASLRAQGAAHLFREGYVEAKAERMAEHWYQEHAERRRVRQEARDRGRADRLAYIHSKYGGAEGVALGRVHSLRKRRRIARDQARRCATLRQCDWSQQRIAVALGIDERTVRRHLIAHAGRVMRARIVGSSFFHLNRTFGKDESVPSARTQVPEGSEQPLPNVRSAPPAEKPPPDEPDEAQIAAGKAAWERFFGRKLGETGHDEPAEQHRWAVNAFGQRVRVSP